MALLDDNDPIRILQSQIERVINRNDGHTAIAALALTLSSALQLAASKQPHPPRVVIIEMCADLRALTVEMIRSRAAQTRES